jgi:hypothetical protein
MGRRLERAWHPNRCSGLIFAGSAIPSNIVSPAQSRLELTLTICRFIGFSFEEAR